MLIANVPCKVRKLAGYSNSGEPRHCAEKKDFCAVVYYRTNSDKTSVRADSTASRGAAEQLEASVRLLMLPDSDIDVDSLVSLEGRSEVLIVDGVDPRYDTDGEIHHFQVDLRIWH